uniref:Protein RIC1 homolog n=1 Tax=Schistocephalus solidus TaxID=70667 RepID=A0A0X3NZL1_SCHSO
MYYLVDTPTILTELPAEDACIIAASEDDRFVAMCVRNEICFHCQKTFTLLGKYKCKAHTIENFGDISDLCWNETGDTLLMQTSDGFLILLILAVTELEPETASDKLFFPQFSLEVRTVRILKRIGQVTCFVHSGNKIIAGNRKGRIFCMAWSGDALTSEVLHLQHLAVQSALENTAATTFLDTSTYCRRLFWTPTLGGLVAILSDGRVLRLLLPPSFEVDPLKVKAVWVVDLRNPIAVSVNNRFQTIAVGTEKGDIITYRFNDASSSPAINQKFPLPDSVIHAIEKPLGAVKTLTWSLDGYCLAVAWHAYGFALWSVFGNLLYTTLLDQTEVTRHLCSPSFCWTLKGFRLWTVAYFLDDYDRQARRANLLEFRDRLLQNCNQLPSTRRQIANNLSRMKVELDTDSRFGDRHEGYSDDANSDWETGNGVFLLIFNLAKSALVLNPTVDNHLHTLLCTPDSILLCARRFLHCCRNLFKLPVPHFYVRLNFPMRFASLNTAGTRLAVSGRRGFAVCYLPTLSWRLFGNVSQEQAFEVHAGLVWWRQFVVFSAFNHSTGRCELRCYPSTEKLDDQFVSVLLLDATIRPLTLDVVCNQLLVFSTDGHFRSFFLSLDTVRNSVIFRPDLTVNLSTFLPHPPCLTRICPLSTTLPNVPHTPVPATGTLTPDSEVNTSLLFLYAGNLLLFSTAALSSICADEQTSYFSDFITGFSKQEPATQKYRESFSPTLIASNVEVLWTGITNATPASFVETSDLIGDDVDENAEERDGVFVSKRNNFGAESPHLPPIPLLSDSVWVHCGIQGLKIWFPVSCLSEGGARTASILSEPLSPGPLNSRLTPPFHSAPTVNPRGGLFSKGARRVMLSVQLEDLVYPLTVLLDKAAVIATHSGCLRIDRSYYKTLDDRRFHLPWFNIQVKTNLFLPHLLKDLLSKNLSKIALDLATSYQSLPYFQHILELLLHEVLEEEATSKFPIPDPLLPQVCAFIEQFQHFLDVIIQCIRKTEVTWWRHLFCALGRRPKDLFEEALSMDQLGTAASCLVVLQNSESLVVSKQCALILMTKTIEHSQWHLVNDLIRFLRATSMPARMQLVGVTPKDLPGSAQGDSSADPFNEIDLLLERAKCTLLKRARWRLLEELFANLSTTPSKRIEPTDVDSLGDCAVPQWLLRNREHIPDVDNWPHRFLELHQDFNWIIPMDHPAPSVPRRPSSPLHNDPAPSASTASSILLRSEPVPLSASPSSQFDTAAASTTDPTFLPSVRSCQRLYFLLSHLMWVARELPSSCSAQSVVLQWCVLLSVLLLDQQMLFTALSLLTPSARDVKELTGLLKHRSTLSHLELSEDMPLLRLLRGVEAIRQWAVETAPTFAAFLHDLQPKMTKFTSELIGKHRCRELGEEPGNELLKRTSEEPAHDSLGDADSLPRARPPKPRCSSALVDLTPPPPAAIRLPSDEKRTNCADLSSGLPASTRTRTIPSTRLFMSQDIPSAEFEMTGQHLVNPDLSDDIATEGSHIRCTLS